MGEQRGHGPTEQRRSIWVCPECGEMFVRDYRHLHSLPSPPYSEAVALEEVKVVAEAALSRVGAERDELAAHLERVREWAEANALPEDAGAVEEIRDQHGTAAREVLSLLPDPKGEA